VVFDDFVLPQERVADYLTRFSGIVERDLNPKESQRHLITTRAAYLKLRCLAERGCVFVGHGLNRDFWTANIMVPLNQIIDTVEIYHKPVQRYISLRFLTNFVLKRDMQQEVHELKQAGEFEKLLDDLYEYGRKVDWKLGVD
jgi:PAB-dependent poly(A)-specific ribonuclease subunit 2